MQQKCGEILTVLLQEVARNHYANAADAVYPVLHIFGLLCHPVTLAYLFLSPADFDVACNLVHCIRIFRLKKSVN